MQPPILPPPAPRPRRKKRSRSLLLGLLGWMFATGVVVFLGVSAVAGYFLWKASQDLPSYDSLAKYEPPVMTRIHAHDGSLIAEYARERRIFVPINTVPKMVLGAYLSPVSAFRLVAQARFDEQELSLRRQDVFANVNMGFLSLSAQ